MGNEDRVPKSNVKTEQAAYIAEIQKLMATYNQLGDRLTRLAQENQQLTQQRGEVGAEINKTQGSIDACKKILGEKEEEPKKSENTH